MNGLLEMFAISFGFIAMLTSIAALSMVIGMKLSTHKIEWKPLETNEFKPELDQEEKEDDEVLKKALGLQKKKKQEDPLDAVAETSNF